MSISPLPYLTNLVNRCVMMMQVFYVSPLSHYPGNPIDNHSRYHHTTKPKLDESSLVDYYENKIIILQKEIQKERLIQAFYNQEMVKNILILTQILDQIHQIPSPYQEKIVSLLSHDFQASYQQNYEIFVKKKQNEQFINRFIRAFLVFFIFYVWF